MHAHTVYNVVYNYMVAIKNVAKPGPTQASSQVTLICDRIFFKITYMIK